MGPLQAQQQQQLDLWEAGPAAAALPVVPPRQDRQGVRSARLELPKGWPVEC
jgi:hypothetical protein